MRYRFFLIISALSFLSLSGCASLPSPDVMAEHIKDFKLPAEPQKDHALVYFISKSIPGLGLAPRSIYLDGQAATRRVGRVINYQYIYFPVLPGEHVVYAFCDEGCSGDYYAKWLDVSFEAQGGEIYYIFLTNKKGSIANANPVMNVIIERDDPVTGKYLVKDSSRGTGERTRLVTENVTQSRNNRMSASSHGQVVDMEATPPATPEIMVRKSDIDEVPAYKKSTNGRAYAVVIGIEGYRQKLPRADFATQDAKLVTDYLTKALGYPEENVVTLLNDRASNVDMVKYFEKWLPNNVEPGSSVFVYYSGHGAPNPKTGDAYLVPYDGDPSFIDETGYSLKRMYAALGKLPAKEVIVALDSCFSGAGGRSVLAKGARPLVMNLKMAAAPAKNMAILAAASGDQISSTYDEKGHGLFTYFMLKGIKNEDVTRPDGSIKIDDLFDYLKPQVERIARKQYNNEQSPQLFGAGKH